MFGAVSRQVTHGLSLAGGCLEVGFQLGRRTDVFNAGSFALFVECRLHTHPDDGVDRQFVAEDDLAVLIDVNDGH